LILGYLKTLISKGVGKKWKEEKKEDTEERGCWIATFY